MGASPRTRSGVAYLLFVLGISVLAILLLIVATVLPLDPDTQKLLEYADTAVCLLFLIDFLITLARADRKLRYLVTWGWVDLLSSIPAVNVFRLGRLVRAVRILRVLRALRSGRVIATFLLERRAESAFLAATLLSLLLLVLGSVAILQFERGPDSNIHGPADAAWWTIVTLTTVGYGDRYPVTPEGRLVAVVLMVAGVGLFGALSGFVASWFLAPAERRQVSEVDHLRHEIEELKREVEKMSR